MFLITRESNSHTKSLRYRIIWSMKILIETILKYIVNQEWAYRSLTLILRSGVPTSYNYRYYYCYYFLMSTYNHHQTLSDLAGLVSTGLSSLLSYLMGLLQTTVV